MKNYLYKYDMDQHGVLARAYIEKMITCTNKAVAAGHENMIHMNLYTYIPRQLQKLDKLG